MKEICLSELKLQLFFKYLVNVCITIKFSTDVAKILTKPFNFKEGLQS